MGLVLVADEPQGGGAQGTPAPAAGAKANRLFPLLLLAGPRLVEEGIRALPPALTVEEAAVGQPLIPGRGQRGERFVVPGQLGNVYWWQDLP